MGFPTTLSATVADGTLVSYDWSFGDGDTGSGHVVEHVYPDAGLYTAVVTASNDVSWLTAATTVTIYCNLPSDPDFAWVPPLPSLGETVFFSGGASGTMPISFTWAFGDGTFGSGPNPTHAYAVTGTYTVIMTATNACGWAGITRTLVVSEACNPPTNTFLLWIPPTPAAGEEVTFTGFSAGTPPLTFTWAFGDGGTGSGVTTTHSYTAAGDYTVTLTVTNACGEAVAEEAVHVCEPVHGAGFAWDPPVPIVDEAVAFTGTAQGEAPFTFTWAFGDGRTGSGITATHSYTAAGGYTVTLTVANPCGVAVVTQKITAIVELWQLYLPLIVRQHDAYEPDNTWEQARRIVPGEGQRHDIDPVADQDWVVFAASQENSYEILVYDPGPALDAFLELYDRDGETLIAENDDCADPQYASCITFAPAGGADGDYYVRVSDYEWHGGPQDYAYTIRLEVNQ